MDIKYNRLDKQSILDYASKLKDKSLREALDQDRDIKFYGGKGSFGQFVEEQYFGYKINSDAEPDFKEVGLELKCSPLKEIKNGDYRAKERLVLNIINYMNVVNEKFETSSFWSKNANILLIFYLYEKEKFPFDYVIKLVGEWNFPEQDIEIIKNDWLTIINKIKVGKAHELSEGDTFYLGACTKGASASSVRQQPYSDISAKQRAFSFKTGYVNHIIASIAGKAKQGYGKLIESVELIKNKTIDEIVIEKFQTFYGKSVEEIAFITGVPLDINRKKGFYARVTRAVLNIQLGHEIEEFEKANIEVKSVRVENDNSISESVSFPAFEFTKIYRESWINCELKEISEKKFLFIFFKKNDVGNYYLERAIFWNMPLSDRNEVRRVWLRAKKVIQEGNIFQEYKKGRDGKYILSKKGNRIKLNNLPKISENTVCHVRPHGKDASDTYPLPIKDKKLDEWKYTKQCFWLNASYVKDEIYLK